VECSDRSMLMRCCSVCACNRPHDLMEVGKAAVSAGDVLYAGLMYMVCLTVGRWPALCSCICACAAVLSLLSCAAFAQYARKHISGVSSRVAPCSQGV
jgi:cobalamin synthase